MTHPDNARLLADEHSLLEAETSLAREEQRLWQRLEASVSGTDAPRRDALAARLSRLEKLPDASPAEVARARSLVQAAPAAPTPATGERAGAVQARRAALQSREAALKALTASVTQLEAARAAHARQLDEAEALLTGIEESARRAEADRKAQEAARRAAQVAADKAARQAAEEAARTKTAPELPAVDPLTTVPGAPAFDAMKTTPGMPALELTQSSSPALSVPPPRPAAAPAPTAAMPVAVSTATPAPAKAVKRKSSRRRRVRLAPPPKKLDVEVATYGEDTFYTGWNGSISDGGLFVVSLETLPPGHELDVELVVEGKTIKSRGRVEFNRRDNLANPECQSGAGIKLLNLSRDHAATIESFFEQRPPLFFVQP